MEWIPAKDLHMTPSIIKTTTTDWTAAANPNLQDLKKAISSLTIDYLSFRNTYWGQVQPVNYKILWKMYLEDPIVSGSINAIVNAVVGDGYHLRGGGRLHKKILARFLDKNSFTSKLRDIVTQLLVYGDAYIELDRDDEPPIHFNTEAEFLKAYYAESSQKQDRVLSKTEEDYTCEIYGCPMCGGKYDETFGLPVSCKHKALEIESYKSSPSGLLRALYVSDASSIRIDYNEHGEVIKYIQRVLHRRVDFYPEEMVHIAYNRVGGRVYGMSTLLPIIETLQVKQLAERFNSDYFRRGAIPRMLYMVPNLSKEQTERLQNKLQTLSPQQDIIMTTLGGAGNEFKAQPLLPPNTDMQFSELLHYYRQNIIAATGTPPLFLGITEGSNRANAQTQMESFDRLARFLKLMLSDAFNGQLFTKEHFGFDDVSFVFNQDNSREEQKCAQIAAILAPMTNIYDNATGRPLIYPDEVRQVLKLPPLESVDPDETVAGGIESQLQQLEQAKPAPVAMRPGANVFPPRIQQGPGSIRPDRYADPRTTVGRGDRADAQNTQQQMDNKMLKDYDWEKLRATEEWKKERTEHPYFTDEEIDRIVLDHMGKKTEFAITAATGAGYPLTSNEKQDITGRDVTARDRDFKNPFGATPHSLEKPKNREEALRTAREREIQQVAGNPIDNSLNLNQDRVFPKDDLTIPQKGESPLKTTKPRIPGQDDERDEVDQAGRTVWAQNDADKRKGEERVKEDKRIRENILRMFNPEEARLKLTKATFYQGICQLDETEGDNHESKTN